jgi:hypothetical protein
VRSVAESVGWQVGGRRARAASLGRPVWRCGPRHRIGSAQRPFAGTRRHGQEDRRPAPFAAAALRSPTCCQADATPARECALADVQSATKATSALRRRSANELTPTRGTSRLESGWPGAQARSMPAVLCTGRQASKRDLRQYFERIDVRFQVPSLRASPFGSGPRRLPPSGPARPDRNAKKTSPQEALPPHKNESCFTPRPPRTRHRTRGARDWVGRKGEREGQLSHPQSQ